jgi:hypothetical protein
MHPKIDFNIANTVLSTQSAHVELLHRPSNIIEDKKND